MTRRRVPFLVRGLAVVHAATLAVTLITAIAPISARADEAVTFITAIDDLPLMPGLVEDAAAGMVFDAPAGRIVEAYATGSVGRDAILRFYADTLPQLGWRADGATTFRREGETLDLEFADSGKTLTVRFALSPATAGDDKQ
jgi:hypothetical protein